MPEDHPKKSKNLSVAKAVPLTARMETTMSTGQQPSESQGGSQPQQTNKQALAPVTEDEGTGEGNSTGRYVNGCDGLHVGLTLKSEKLKFFNIDGPDLMNFIGIFYGFLWHNRCLLYLILLERLHCTIE